MATKSVRDTNRLIASKKGDIYREGEHKTAEAKVVVVVVAWI